jgi:hypothetical protein
LPGSSGSELKDNLSRNELLAFFSVSTDADAVVDEAVVVLGTSVLRDSVSVDEGARDLSLGASVLSESVSFEDDLVNLLAMTAVGCTVVLL